MKILHLSMLYPPHIIGGAEKSVCLLAEAQAKAGYTVAAACTTPYAPVKETINGVTVYRMPHETDFWAEEWPNHNKLERAVRRFKMNFNFKLQDHFKKVIEDFKPDIVHTHSLTDVSTRVWLAAHEMNVPILHTLRDYDMLCANSAMFKDGHKCDTQHLKCKFFTSEKVKHHKHVSAVAAVGQETLDTHLNFGLFQHIPSDLRKVVWNPAIVEGVPSDYKKPDIEGPFVFGYLGRINIEKGVGTLIDAARRLAKTREFKILVAGKAPSEDDPIYQMAKGLPIEFLGFVQPKPFFEQIDVLIVPSIWAEPLPRTILESYATGTPALGSISGGIPDLIGHDNDCWLFKAGDDADLSNKMNAIIDRGRETLPSKAEFNHVLSQTRPEDVVKNYEGLYKKMLS